MADIRTIALEAHINSQRTKLAIYGRSLITLEKIVGSLLEFVRANVQSHKSFADVY